ISAGAGGVFNEERDATLCREADESTTGTRGRRRIERFKVFQVASYQKRLGLVVRSQERNGSCLTYAFNRPLPLCVNQFHGITENRERRCVRLKHLATLVLYGNRSQESIKDKTVRRDPLC